MWFKAPQKYSCDAMSSIWPAMFVKLWIVPHPCPVDRSKILPWDLSVASFPACLPSSLAHEQFQQQQKQHVAYRRTERHHCENKFAFLPISFSSCPAVIFFLNHWPNFRTFSRVLRDMIYRPGSIVRLSKSNTLDRHQLCSSVLNVGA